MVSPNAELFFRNMRPSPELSAAAKERAEKLEKLYDHIVGMKVVIQLANHTHRTGEATVPDVHVEIQVPGQSLTVNKAHGGADAMAELHKAFDAAEAQLKDYKARKMGHVKQRGAELSQPE